MKKTMVLLVVVTLAGAVWAEEPVDKDFQLFMEFYAGEFNNHNQVYFETNDHYEKEVPEDSRHPWHHYTNTRADAPAFGEFVFFNQINDEGPDGAVVRQRVNVFVPDAETGTIRQTFFAIEPGQERVEYPIGPSDLAKLEPGDLRGYPEGCEVVWRRQADQFLGTIEKGDCAVVSKRSGKTLYIWAEMILSKNESWHAEGGTDADFNPIFGPPDGVPFKLSRVEYLSCWAAFLKDEEAEEWDSFRGIRIGNQGGVTEFATTHDEPRHYRLQLMQTVFPAGNWPDVLELFVFEKGNDKALSYAWTSPDAERIGVNLRWMQVGCQAE